MKRSKMFLLVSMFSFCCSLMALPEGHWRLHVVNVSGEDVALMDANNIKKYAVIKAGQTTDLIVYWAATTDVGMRYLSSNVDWDSGASNPANAGSEYANCTEYLQIGPAQEGEAPEFYTTTECP